MTGDGVPNGCTPRGGGERGQSQTIGFVFILMLSVTTIAGGAYYGLTGLKEASSAAPARTAEASLGTVRGDYYDLASGSPYRGMDVELYDARLYYGSPVKMSIKADSASDSFSRKQVQFRPLVIEAKGNYYIFSLGAVIRATDEGAYIKTGPDFRISSGDAYIPLFASQAAAADTRVAVQGRQTVPVVAYKRDSEFHAFEPTDAGGNPELITATVRVKSPRAEAWASYFRQSDRFSNVNLKNNGKQVTAEFTTHHLYVRETTVETDIQTD